MRALTLFILFTLAQAADAGVDKTLAYPDGTPSAEEIMRQVYFVNHHYAVRNISFGDKSSPVKLVLMSTGKAPRLHSFIRQLNNDYTDGVTKHRDRVVFKFGKLRGTGILVNTPVDDNQAQHYSMWLPALRKVRRHNEPAHNDAWGGSPFTYGDIYLRKPGHETHELIGEEKFPACLKSLQRPDNVRDKRLADLPEPACDVRGRAVYKLKSQTRFPNWWYDYREVWIDQKTFADYRSIYYKNDQPVKIIDKGWRSMKLDDPRALYWRYWYADDYVNDNKGLAYVQSAAVRWDQKVKKSLWTEQSLRRIKR